MSKWTNVCLQVDKMPRITEKLTMFVGRICWMFFVGAAVCSVKNASACIFKRFTPASVFPYSPYMEYSAYFAIN